MWNNIKSISIHPTGSVSSYTYFGLLRLTRFTRIKEAYWISRSSPLRRWCKVYELLQSKKLFESLVSPRERNKWRGCSNSNESSTMKQSSDNRHTFWPWNIRKILTPIIQIYIEYISRSKLWWILNMLQILFSLDSDEITNIPMMNEWPNVVPYIRITMCIFPPINRWLAQKPHRKTVIFPKIRMLIYMNTSNSPLKKAMIESYSPGMSNSIMIVTDNNRNSSNSINMIRIERKKQFFCTQTKTYFRRLTHIQ